MKHKMIWGSVFLWFISIVATDSKWVVVTTINYPTAALKKLASLPDWHLVVVGDKKTPSDWNLPGCEFLSVEKQKSLGYRIIGLLPFNHYCRKSIGYLYAIQHGATIVYDTDDDTILMNDDIPFLPKEQEMLSFEAGQSLVANVYAHFGQPSVWPRGYPLSQIMRGTIPCSETKYVHPFIQQSLVNNDPDVDALFRLTRSLPLSFVDNVPIALSTGLMCPFNTQNTIFHYEALWGLLVPMKTSFRVCDIWRGYWVQRLLWDIGGSLVFTAPTALQVRNEHNYMHDFISEIDLYVKSMDLVNFLNIWKPRSTHFFDEILELTQAMIKEKFFTSEEENLMKAWLTDLIDVGYKFPSRTIDFYARK